MSDDIGAWYDRKRQEALQLSGELNALTAQLAATAPRSPEFVQLAKRIAITKAQLERARYVGD